MVLGLLGLLFSLLTLREQHPTGEDAGRQVARQYLKQHGPNSSVLIIGRPTDGDRLFTQAAENELNKYPEMRIIATINGSPADLRSAIDSALKSKQTIDGVIANKVTAGWSVYDRYPEVGREKCITPQPYMWPDFLKSTNILGVANQTSIYAIIAIGMTMVIVTAGIDLSVGSLVALSSIVSTMLIVNYGRGVDATLAMSLLGIVAGIASCAAAGTFNGLMITLFRIPPFIVTLSMMLMASGLAFRLSEGQSIPEVPDTFKAIGGGTSFGLPNPVWIMIISYLLAHVVMSHTVFGRYVYAIGGNEEASRLSGVPVNRILIVVYTICGALAGLGGVMLASKLAAGDPKFGLMYELEVIAAVVVGGTSLMGGQGKIFGTLVGAFIIAVIKNGMNLTNVDPFNQKIVLGAVLLIAVLIDTLKSRHSNS